MRKILMVIIALIITKGGMAQMDLIGHINGSGLAVIHFTALMDSVTLNTTHSFTDDSLQNLSQHSKFRIEIVNDSDCWLCSPTRWIVGYVLRSRKHVLYFDYNGAAINTDKVRVIKYMKLQRRNSRCNKNDAS
jgi:hypothetical protein